MTKQSKTLWIVLAAIVVAIALFSVFSCVNSSTKIDVSELLKITETRETTDGGTQSQLSITTDGNFLYKNLPDGAIKSALQAKLGTKNLKAETKFSFSTIKIDGYNLNFSLNSEYGNVAFTTTYARGEAVTKYETIFANAGISFNYADPNAGSIWSSLLPLLGMVLIAIVFFVLMMQTQGGTKSAMNFAKTNARLNHNIKVRFSDVAGAEEEKTELAEVVDFLKNPKKYSELGARIPKGVLLVGPPGTGKTLFAKAVAGEAGVPFFSISGSDFVEMFVGVGASRVRDLFDAAKKSMPCIVFIDEIDAVGRQRGTGMGGGHDEREQTLNQLLVQMDGFESNDGIIVMAATNRADILDPALLRPGRFDRQIYVNVPDVRGREAILKVHARNKPLAPDVNFKTVARMTSGFSGADLENLLNESAILAARENRRFITNKDLYEGINKVLLGPQKKSHLVTETDKRITAYHESGHAILARLLPNCDPVHEVSIIPRGQAAGYTMTRPDSDDNHLTKAKLLDDIVMTLGGRVAEELIIKDISAGASGDIQAVSKRARLMVTEWGMSEKVGPISYASDKEIFIGRDMASHVTYSEETAAIIDEEVRSIIETALNKARTLLGENKKLLDNMARLLIERETIFTEEVDMLMEGKDVEEIMAFMDANEKNLSENPFDRKNPTIIKAAGSADNSDKKTVTEPNKAENKAESETSENKEVAGADKTEKTESTENTESEKSSEEKKDE